MFALTVICGVLLFVSIRLVVFRFLIQYQLVRVKEKEHAEEESKKIKSEPHRPPFTIAASELSQGRSWLERFFLEGSFRKRHAKVPPAEVRNTIITKAGALFWSIPSLGFTRSVFSDTDPFVNEYVGKGGQSKND